MTDKTKAYLKLVSFLFLVLVLYLINRIFGLSDRLGLLTDNQTLFESLRSLVNDHLFYAVLCYMAFTTLSCVFLALPGITYAVLAGLFFGPFYGTLLCSLSASLGALLSFLAGRFFLKDSIKPLIMKNGLLKRWLFDEKGKNTFFILMITRLVPLFPFNLQNFAYGITDMGILPYTVGSFLFMIPGTALYTVGTAGLLDAKNRWLYLFICLLLAVFVFGIAYYLRKNYVEENKEND